MKKIDSLEMTTARLTELADRVVQKLFDEIFVSESVALLAMGKFGGKEISFRSDLDVVLIADDDSPIDIIIAKAKQFLERLSEMTSMGKLYDVDARLRPEGQMAPLVVNLSRYKNYFETRAMLWEKQALIKTRPICGDKQLLRTVSSVINQMVYTGNSTAEHAAGIIEMRERQSAEKIKTVSDAQLDLKFGKGSLLDIEYLAQWFQLKFGNEFKDIRSTSTLDCLRALKNNDLIEKAHADQLMNNYQFIRKLEFAAFMLLERKSSKLPSDEKQLAFLCKFIDIYSVTDLLKSLSDTKKQNEELFSKYLGDL